MGLIARPCPSPKRRVLGPGERAILREMLYRERKEVEEMRRLTLKDAAATAVLVAVGVPYVGYLINGEMPFIQDPRGMASVGLIGLVLCFAAWGLGIHTTFGKVMLVLGAAAVGLGLAALIVGAEGSEILLALFMGAIAIVYLVQTVYHAMFGSPDAHEA
jgi:hypothetical protein